MPKLLGLSMECMRGQLRGFLRYVVRFASGNYRTGLIGLCFQHFYRFSKTSDPPHNMPVKL